jgi:hypothetical protein
MEKNFMCIYAVLGPFREYEDPYILIYSSINSKHNVAAIGNSAYPV